MNRQILLLFFPLLIAHLGTAQKANKGAVEELNINGQIVSALITEDNDTLIIADLEDVTVSSFRTFKNKDDERRYRIYRKYAVKVYPYAVKAIKIFRETEEVTKTMNKRKRKKHIKRLQKELKEEFETPLKKLTKTQGKILTKMIERETGTPIHTLVKNLRGGAPAAFWNTVGKFYGYDLKEGYIIGQDPILDAVLTDFNVAHKMQ